MNNHEINAEGLVLCVPDSGNIGKLKEFFNGKKYGRDRFASMVTRLLDGVLVLKEFLRNYLPVLFF